MSTISVSNITTANGSTDLTIGTGNTSAGQIILSSAGGMNVSSNSTKNVISISTTGTITLLTNTTISSNATLSGTLQTISGNVNVDSGVFFVDGTNNRVGVNTTAPDTDFMVTGSANVSANVTVTNRVTANVFVGAAPLSIAPKIAFGATAGNFAHAPTISGTTIGTLALTANRQYFVPLYVPYVLTTTTLACEVTTSGPSSSIRLNIYASDANNSPTGSPVAADVLVSSATTGVKTGAYAVTLKPGIYWASMVCNATAPTIRSILGTGVISISTLGATPVYSHIYGTFTFAAMGAFSGVTSITGVSPATQVPLIGVY